MPQSLANIMIHLIFSTKSRIEWISANLEGPLYAYLCGIADNLRTPIIEIGGMPDHVHILMHLSRIITMSEVVQQLKTGSSRFIKETEPASAANFTWQKGYGAFSVSPSQKALVIAYIKGQKEHHQEQSFQNEYRLLLHKHKISFDEKHVWD